MESGFKDVQRKPGRCPGHVREDAGWAGLVAMEVESGGGGLEKQVKLVGTRWGRGCAQEVGWRRVTEGFGWLGTSVSKKGTRADRVGV